MPDAYAPRPEHKFTFGLWTVGNVGRDPFGPPVREPLSPPQLVRLLAEVGAWGVNLHDDDLIPLGTRPAERQRIIKDFKQALRDTGLVVPMATTNLFSHPAFKDGAFTSNDPRVRAFALHKTLHAIDLAVDLGAKIYVCWGGREGTESDAGKNPADALKRMREAFNFLAEYVLDQGYDLKFALEAKPNEPRGDIYLPTTGAMLAFIETLAHPELVGVNPEMAHEHMAGLNFLHAVAQAWEAGKLWHIDLNDQNFARYDQDFRFGAHNYKQAFLLVRFLEDVGYSGPRHFDAHAYRTEDYAGVKDFARGCMRSYLILKEKAAAFNAHREVQALLAELARTDGAPPAAYSRSAADALKARAFDEAALSARGYGYERLDQLLFDTLLGVS